MVVERAINAIIAMIIAMITVKHYSSDAALSYANMSYDLNLIEIRQIGI